MGVLLQLAGTLLLLIAGIELCRRLVGLIFTLVMKAGLLTNIAVNQHTELSVIKTSVQISFWSQLWDFLQAPALKKLVTVEISSVHFLIVTSHAKQSSTLQQREATTPAPLWQTLDTSIGLHDIRNPMWDRLRVWIPRLTFLRRCAHVVELCVTSASVDVVQKDRDAATTVLSIMHGSVVIKGTFCTETSELSLTVTLSRTQPMQIGFPEQDATLALGYTQICIRVPSFRDLDDIRAPIPSVCSVLIDLIQVNLDLEHLIRLILSSRRQQYSEASSCVVEKTDATDVPVQDGLNFVMIMLRVAEVSPNDLCIDVRKLELNIVDAVLPRNSGSICTLGLSGLSAKLYDDSDQERGSTSTHSMDYPMVTRKANIALGGLTLFLTEVDAHSPTSTELAMVKLGGLNVSAEGALYADVPGLRTSEEIDEDDTKEPVLHFKTSISGESRSLDVIISRSIGPWAASCCTIYDREAAKMQTSGVPPLAENITLNQGRTLMDYCEVELDTYFKLLKTDVTLIALDQACDVLPRGVPSVSLSLGEISAYGHPFVSGDRLGIRAQGDIQCSRVKASYFTSSESAKCSFLSLDFVRVFILPVATMMQTVRPAGVEMEVEWVEVRWAPDVLHAIGGTLELGIFILAPFLHESRCSKPDIKDASRTFTGWRTNSVPPMHQLEDVAQDIGTPGEIIAFRCAVKPVRVIFPYLYDGQRKVDCVTVDTFSVSLESTTGQLRIAVLGTRAFSSQRTLGDTASFSPKSSYKQTRFQHKTFAPHALRSCTTRKELPTATTGGSTGHDAPFLTADSFFLEENRVIESTKTVVDIFANGIQLEWDISTHLRIMELVRRITFSSWEMIYRVRSTYALHCTPEDSVYNRVHGLNPPLDDIDECLRYERLFTKLISASGDTLHRLHATNISVDVELCDQVHARLSVGVFAGDDLPEVWRFEDIFLKVNELEMVEVGAVHVRHTLGKQTEYVFGEFEDMLRKRLSACKRSTMVLDQSLKDGVLIDIDKLHLRTSYNFPLQAHVAAIESSLDPFTEKLAVAMASHYRPQQELFYKYFLRTPVASHQKELWLHLDDIGFKCHGNMLDSWLERMYPVWIEVLEEQELREHMLNDHIASLKITNADSPCDDSYKDMRTLLTEKNARLYIQTAKKLKSLSLESPDDALISVCVDHIDADVTFGEDITASWSSIKKLDEATAAIDNALKVAGRDPELFTPSSFFFVGIHVKAALADLIVRMRRFPTPLMTCERLSVAGQVFLTAFKSGYDDEPFDFTAAVRCFMDLAVDVSTPVLYFSPGYLYALDEVAGLALGLLPLAILDIDERNHTSVIDIARRLLHGKIAVTVKDAYLRLLNAATSFESSDFLEINVHRVYVAYSSGSIDVDITRVAVKIEPDSLSYIAELSHLKLQVWLKWGSMGNNPLIHYVYPIEFLGAGTNSVANERFVLRFPHPIDSSGNERTSSNPLQAFQATKLSIFVSGSCCPASSENGDTSNTDKRSKRDMAARTAAVLYSKNVEWMIGFARNYQKMPLYPLPHRRGNARRALHLPSTDLVSILEGITVEGFDLVGLDLALYASEKHPVGVRAFIDDKISCSGALLKGSHHVFADTEAELDAANGAVRRLSLCIGASSWIVHDVNVDARDIQVRLCTSDSGSRGESLVFIKQVSLIVGGGKERAPTHDNGVMKARSSFSTKRMMNAPSFVCSQATYEGKEKARAKQNILEYFDIPHENPFAFRDDVEAAVDVHEAGAKAHEIDERQNDVLDEFQRDGFLLGLFSKEVRVTVTMVALESLVDIADTWVQVAVNCLPELLGDRAEAAVLLHGDDDKKEDSDATEEEVPHSPKKFTSLAQDPKFSGISLQGGAGAPVHRQQFEPTPYSNTDTVRPVDTQSSKVASQVEALQSKEEIVPLQVTNCKLLQAFIMVKFEDCQISVQDHLHKGSILLALNAGTLHDAVSSDSSHERINLNVDGSQLFTAPLDVDVKSHTTWLKPLANGSYCLSSYGLLRQVIAPIPAQVTIWIDRDKSVIKNRVSLDIPAIQVQVNLASKDILENLATTATELINAKLVNKKNDDRSDLTHGRLRDDQHQERSLHHLVALKKQLKWKIAALEWRRSRIWDYRLNDRAMAAASTAGSARSLAFEIETAPLFRRRKVSSGSVSSIATSTSAMGSTQTNRYEDEQFADEVQQLTQRYQSLSELTRIMANDIRKQLQPNPLPNVDLEFVLNCASLTLSGENVDIVRAQVSSLGFKMQLFEDHSGKFALTLEDLSVNNLCPGTPYPDMVLPVYSRSWEGDDMFLRIDAEIVKSAGGMVVVQHFEVNVHPIQVCITQEVIMQLVGFFSPSNRTNSDKEEQREEVRSHFLQARTATSVSDGRVGSAILKAVKVAGKAAAHPLSLGRTHHADSDDDVSSRKAKAGHHDNTPEDTVQWIPNMCETNDLSVFETEQHHTELTERGGKDRATNNILFKRIRLGAVEVVLTYKNKKSSASHTSHPHLPHTTQPQALEDMRGFEVKTHALVYCDKTCSPLDLLMRIRRDILLDVLSQVGRNFTNIGNFLRDQFDSSRWAAFDGLAPLKSLSTTLTAMGPSHAGVVVPLVIPPDELVASSSLCDAKANDSRKILTAQELPALRSTEPFWEWQARGASDISVDPYNADISEPSTPTSADATRPKQTKKRSLAKFFSRRKSSLTPSPTMSTQ